MSLLAEEATEDEPGGKLFSTAGAASWEMSLTGRSFRTERAGAFIARGAVPGTA